MLVNKYGVSLVKPNEDILSARVPYSMTGEESKEGARASRYLLYKHDPRMPRRTYEEIKGIFQCGLLAMQMLKPVRTLGIHFYGDYTPSGRFLLTHVIRNPPMKPSPWALEKALDREMLKLLPSKIERVQQIMEGSIVEKKNSLFLLQLGLEHNHPLIKGL